MTPEREQEIIAKLQSIIDNFIPTANDPEITMWRLICSYNDQDSNPELIGGDWAAKHGFNLP